MPPYTWASSDDTIAYVDEDGLVDGRERGDAVITVTDAPGQTATVTVTLESQPSGGCEAGSSGGSLPWALGGPQPPQAIAAPDVGYVPGAAIPFFGDVDGAGQFMANLPLGGGVGLSYGSTQANGIAGVAAETPPT